MSTQNQNNIYPKPCAYNCNTLIYWNHSTNEYWEVFTKKKHICPNRVNNKPSVSSSNTSSVTGVGVSATKSTYYSKKPWTTQPKPRLILFL